MDVPKNIKDEIWEYCRLNDITDIDSFMLNSLQQGFNIEKYGTTPIKINQKEPEVVEIIKEVIKEVPVEKIVEVIKEIEVIKEVPVEVIKVIEKEVYITNDGQTLELQEKLIQTQKDSSKYLSYWENGVSELKSTTEERDTLLKKLGEYEKRMSELDGINESEQIRLLGEQINNLKIELELEQNRNFTPEKVKPTKTDTTRASTGNVISWISKDERDSGDIYDE